MCLRDLKPGQSAIITEINLDGKLKSRLMTMGLINGTKVKLEKTAPLGDPIQIKVRGYNLSFRKSDAKYVEVDLC